MNLEADLSVVPNFPKEGIQFLDFSPLLSDGVKFQNLLNQLQKATEDWQFNKIVSIESRGFILGAALANKMNCGMVMVRKPGKLPGETLKVSYELEYGSDTLELLPSSLTKEDQVLIIDDVLATGGTAQAAQQLVEQTGAKLSGTLFFIEIGFLKGREKLKGSVRNLILK